MSARLQRSVDLQDKHELEEEGAQGVRVLEVCKGIEESFHRHTRSDVEDRSESHCYSHQLHSNQKRVIPYENHLLSQFPIRICLWTDFPVEMEQFLERFILTRHYLPAPTVSTIAQHMRQLGCAYKADNMHEQSRKRITVQHHNEDFLHGLDFCVFVSLFQCISKRR